MRYAIAVTLLLCIGLFLWVLIPPENGLPEGESTSTSDHAAPTTPSEATTSFPGFSDAEELESSVTQAMEQRGPEITVVEEEISGTGSIRGYLYSNDPDIAVGGVDMLLEANNPGYHTGQNSASRAQKRTRSNDDGTFAFERLAHHMLYRIQLEGSGLAFAPSASTMHNLTPEQEHISDLALEVVAGGFITGRVYDKDTDEPLPGNYVAAIAHRTHMRQQPAVYVSGRSDAEGRYRIENIPPGQYRVYDVERPNPDIPLFMAALHNASTYLMGDAAARNMSMRRGDFPRINAVVEAGATAENIDVPVTVFPSAAITGVVRMPDDSPAAEVRISANPRPSTPDDHTFNPLSSRLPDGMYVMPSNTITDEEGQFSIDKAMVGYAYQLHLRKDNLQQNHQTGELPEEGIHGLELVMERKGGLSGVVRTTDGKAVPHLDLRLANTRLALNERLDHGALAGDARSDEEGAFAFHLLEQGEYYIYVVSQYTGDMPLMELGTQRLRAGEVVDDLELIFQPPADSIRGRVITSNGEPVAQAQITATAGEGMIGMQQLRATSNADGEFLLFPELMQPHLVMARKPPYVISEKANVRPGQQVELVLDEGLTLRGQVLCDRTGEPITQYSLSAISLHDPRSRQELAAMWPQGEVPPEQRYRTQQSLASGSVAGPHHPEGRFEITGVGQNVMIHVHSVDNYYDYREVLENITPASANREIIIRLKEAPTIAGIVQDRQRRPVADAVVRFGDAERPTMSGAPGWGMGGVYTDIEGRFSLQPRQEDGATGVVASHEDYLPAGAAIPVSPQAQRNIVITLEEGGRIEGRITKAGQPVAGASVHYQGQDLMGAHQYAQPAITDEAGRYEIVNLPTGSGTLRIEEPRRDEGPSQTHRQPHSLELEVASGLVTVADFDIPLESGVIYGTIRLSDGSIPHYAHVTAYIAPDDGVGMGGRSFSTQMDADGSYYLDELPGGQVSIQVNAQANAPVSTGDLDTDARQHMRPHLETSDQFELPPGGRVQRDFVLEHGNELQFLLSRNQPDGVEWMILVFEGQISRNEVRELLTNPGSMQPASYSSSYDNFVAYNLEPGSYTAVLLEMNHERAARQMQDNPDAPYVPELLGTTSFIIANYQRAGAYEIPLRF